MSQRARDFWEYVNVGAPDECWEWTGAKSRYGHVRRAAKLAQQRRHTARKRAAA